MVFPFSMREDDLTDALFHGVSLRSTGSGSKADARAQARAMLAANVSVRGSRVTSVRGTSNPERAGVGASP